MTSSGCASSVDGCSLRPSGPTAREQPSPYGIATGVRSEHLVEEPRDPVRLKPVQSITDHSKIDSADGELEQRPQSGELDRNRGRSADVLRKLPALGSKTPAELSLAAVRAFRDDAVAAGLTLQLASDPQKSRGMANALPCR